MKKTFTFFFILLFPIILSAQTSPLNGIYTIGGVNSDFQTFSSAADSLNSNGISGPVVFNIQPGNYSEQLVITEISGASKSNTITFQSSTGLNTDVVISYSANSSADNYVLFVDGADYINFRNITFKATASIYADVIILGGGANYNVFEGNIIESRIGGGQTQPICVNSLVGSLNNYNRFKNNKVIGGYQSFFIRGVDENTREYGNAYEGNEIIDVAYYGFRIMYQDTLSICSNYCKNLSSFAIYGLYVRYSDHLNVINNKFILDHGNHGMLLHYCDGDANYHNLIYNNFISISGIHSSEGFYLNRSTFTDIFFNSINISSRYYDSYCFMHYGPGPVNLKNNIFSNNNGGLTYKLLSPSSISSLDYNILYTDGPKIAFWSTDTVSTLSDLQSISNYELNSISIKPPFVSDSVLYLSNSSINGFGSPISSIPFDIDGNHRDSIAPTIGAHEFITIPYDAGLTKILQPSDTLIEDDIISVEVVISNNGTDTINNMDIVYYVNNGNPIIQSYSGTLLPSVSDTVILSDITISVGNSIICAYVICPGDSNNFSNRQYKKYFGQPLYDPTLLKIENISGGCDLGNDTIKIWIRNDGVAQLNSGLTATYQIWNISTPVLETVSTAINPGDTVIFSFNTLIDLSVNSIDSLFKIKAWVDHSDDIYHQHDSAETKVTSIHIPTPPIVSDTTILYGANVILHATSQDSVVWYSSQTDTTVLATGNTFITPPLYDTTVYWLESVEQLPSVKITEVTQWGAGNGQTDPYPNWMNGNSVFYGLELVNMGSIPADLTGHTINYKGKSWEFPNGLTLQPSEICVLDNGSTSGGNASYNYYLTRLGGTSSHIANYYLLMDRYETIIDAVATNGATIPSYLGATSGDWTGNIPSSNTKAGVVRILSDNNSASDWLISDVIQQTIGSINPPLVGIINQTVGCPSVRVPLTVYPVIPFANDISMYDIISPSAQINSGQSIPIEVSIRNYGYDNLTSVTINWEIDGNSMPPYSWTGYLPFDSLSTVVLDNVVFSYGTHNLKVWTTLPNGIADPNNANDTLSIQFEACLSGNYTLGTQNSDFVSFSDAIDALELFGICSSVVFNVTPGTYTEQLVFKEVQGASPNNTITFQSENNDSTSVIIKYGATNTNEKWTIKLDGADYYKFKKLTLESTSIYPTVVVLDNGASYNELSGNIIICKKIKTSWSYAGIWVDDTASRGNKYLYNRILNAIHGILIFNHKYKSTIFGNEILDFFVHGVYVGDSDSTEIIANKIITKKTIPNSFAIGGIYIYGSKFALIKQNIISVESGDMGIQMLWCDAPSTSPIVVANNMVILHDTLANTGGIGMIITDCDNVKIVYNSVNISGTINSGATTYAFLEESNSAKSFLIENNIFCNKVGGYSIDYRSFPGASIVSNYNDLYSTIVNGIGWGTGIGDLTTYQYATGLDSNSISTDPIYLSDQDLHTSLFELDSAASPITGIIVDIDGDIRDPQFPDIGADEFDTKQNDAGIYTINEPTSYISGGISDIKVSVRNFGYEVLSSLIVQWSINENMQTPFYWSGIIYKGNQTDSITIGQHNFVTGITKIKVWGDSPNNQADENHKNDTTRGEILVCSGPLSGIYYIGGLNADFPLINDAVNALKHCGVAGPVIFNITPGVYNEQIYLPEIIGASLTNTITFQSSMGDSTSVIINYNAYNTNNNFIIRLDGADYFRFKWLTIRSNSSTGFGHVFLLENGCQFNEFIGNIVESNDYNGTDANSGFKILSNNGNNSNNIIKYNKVSKCTNAISWTSNGNYIEDGNVIEHNIIDDFYRSGIKVKYQNKVRISSNYFSSSKSNEYIIDMDYCNKAIEITNNIIAINSTNGTSFCGIYLNHSHGDSINVGLIANNFISYTNKVSGAGFNAYGILSSSSYHNYYYNSINLENTVCDGGAAFYLINSGPVGTVNVQNNIFVHNNSYSYYISNDYRIDTSDNNDLYTTGPAFVWWNNAQPDLQSLQTASGKDKNSVSFNPGFVSSTDLHITSNALNGLGTPLVAVTNDIDGDPRDLVNPDIGADEFPALNLDAGVIKFTLPNSAFDTIGALNRIEIVIKNFGVDTISGFDIAYDISGSSLIIETYTNTLLPMHIDTFLFTSQFTTISGQFSINSYTMLAGDQYSDNDTLSYSFSGITTIQTAFTDDFESKANIWVTTGTNNQWEVGVPTANTLNSAHSGSKVWATILDGSYYNKRTDILYSPLFDLSKIGITTLKFWHWICSEFYYDGGYIEYLNNNGDWNVLGVKDDPNATNWYNTFNGIQHLWSGKSSGWIYSTYDLNSLTDLGNITQFRFVFTSNISINDDGWAIDDFSFGFPYVPLDVGVNRIITPVDTTLPGSNIQVSIELLNYGTDTIYSIPVSYGINGVTPVTEIWNGILEPYISEVFTFSTQFIPPASSSYIISSYTELLNDAYLLNDTIQKEVINNLNYIVEDIGIEEIVNPIDTTIIGANVPVKVVVRNYGTKTVYSSPIVYIIDGGIPVIESWIGTLTPNDTDTFAFVTKYKPPTSNLYKICAYTGLINDFDNNNDSSCKNITNVHAPLILDAGITSLISPVDTTIFGIPVQVGIEIKNFGTDTLTSLPVYYSIDGGSPYSDMWYGYLPPSTSDIFMFSTAYNPPNDTLYEICTYCNLGNDVDNSNDTICKTLINKIPTGIEFHEEKGFWLGQNIPNPANNTTKIFYSIPSSGKIVFRIVNPISQIVNTSRKEIVHGTNMIELDVSQFKPGIYYYSVEYKGKRLTKKMIISQ